MMGGSESSFGAGVEGDIRGMKETVQVTKNRGLKSNTCCHERKQCESRDQSQTVLKHSYSAWRRQC